MEYKDLNIFRFLHLDIESCYNVWRVGSSGLLNALGGLRIYGMRDLNQHTFEFYATNLDTHEFAELLYILINY